MRYYVNYLVSDIGGGSVSNTTVHCLSDIPLRWMVRQVVQAQVGIQFDRDAVLRANLPESVFTGVGFPAAPLVVTTPNLDGEILLFSAESKENGGIHAAERERRSEESEASTSSTNTMIDAVQPLDDELKKDLWWWLLEIIPTSYTYQDGNGNWHTKWRWVVPFTIFESQGFADSRVSATQFPLWQRQVYPGHQPQFS